MVTLAQAQATQPILKTVTALSGFLANVQAAISAGACLQSISATFAVPGQAAQTYTAGEPLSAADTASVVTTAASGIAAVIASNTAALGTI